MARFRDENGWELFDHNPLTGSTTWCYFDGQKTIFRTDHDAEQIIKGNKAAQAEFAGRKAAEGLGDPVASVPLNLYYEQLAEAQTQGDRRFMQKWLNDSDNAAWRMKGGRV